MLGPRIVLGLGPLAACVALFSVTSCSGDEFTGGAGAAGKSNTAGSASGGTDSGGSAAGGSSSGGDAGETSSGGSDVRIFRSEGRGGCVTIKFAKAVQRPERVNRGGASGFSFQRFD